MLTAEELKNSLGDRAKDIISNGLNLVEKNKKVICPIHQDHKPSMSWFDKGLMWRCHSCEGTIDIYTYLTQYNNMSFQDAMKQVAEWSGEQFETRVKSVEYDLPVIETNQLSKEAIDYMAKRKISLNTLKDWKVEQRDWHGKQVYVFNYYDETNELRFVSYRGIGKGALKGGCELNTEPILWGMWHTVKSEPLVITEGQPDAMAVWESGYNNVVSIPNGAKNFKWIDSNWEYINSFKEIIVFADNDKPGLEFAEEVKRRLKNVKILYSKTRKDANEVLFYEGKEALYKMILDCVNQLPNNLADVSKEEYHSLADRVLEGLETGFVEIDRHIEDLKLGEITIVFGRNGEGKSTFVSQMISHSLKSKVKTFLCSGELSKQKVQEWLYTQMIGTRKQFTNEFETKYRIKREAKPEVIKAIKEWHKDNWYIFVNSKENIDNYIKRFFETMATAANRYGVKLFVIDNLMAVLEENADSLYSDQANFVQKCKQFAIDHNVHVILLAHPNKEKKEITSDVDKGNLEKTDISGSNNIPNKADNIISIERHFGEEDRDCDAIITVLKDRESGQRKTIKYNFSKGSLRFYNNCTRETDKFGWEKFIPTKINNYNGTTQDVVLDCPM